MTRPYETAGARDVARMGRRFATGYLAFYALVAVVVLAGALAAGVTLLVILAT